MARQAERLRASRRVRGIRNSRRDRRPQPLDAARAGQLLDLLDRLRMGHVVQVDAGVRPVAQPGEVGDRRVNGDLEAAVLAQHPEHRGDARVGGDDDVGLVLAIIRIRPRPPSE